MKLYFPLFATLFFGATSTFAEGRLPTAHELIATVELSGQGCLEQALLTEDDLSKVRKFVDGALKRKPYGEYMQSDEYETAKEKLKGGFPKSIADVSSLCQSLKQLPRGKPSDLMFFEPSNRSK